MIFVYDLWEWKRAFRSDKWWICKAPGYLMLHSPFGFWEIGKVRATKQK